MILHVGRKYFYLLYLSTNIDIELYVDDFICRMYKSSGNTAWKLLNTAVEQNGLSVVLYIFVEVC